MRPPLHPEFCLEQSTNCCSERDPQRAGGNFPRALGATSGRECPARAALALVLDRGDGSLGDPVDSGGESLTVVLVHANLWEARLGGCDESTDWERLELLEGQIGELVHTLRVGLGLIGVVCLHLDNGLVVDGLTGDGLITVVDIAEGCSVGGEDWEHHGYEVESDNKLFTI